MQLLAMEIGGGIGGGGSSARPDGTGDLFMALSVLFLGIAGLYCRRNIKNSTLMSVLRTCSGYFTCFAVDCAGRVGALCFY